MNILVCIKQIPDMESKFRWGDGTWYDSADLAWRMNEYDEYALEQAVQLKEKTGGDLTVLCIGPAGEGDDEEGAGHGLRPRRPCGR